MGCGLDRYQNCMTGDVRRLSASQRFGEVSVLEMWVMTSKLIDSPRAESMPSSG